VCGLLQNAHRSTESPRSQIWCLYVAIFFHLFSALYLWDPKRILTSKSEGIVCPRAFWSSSLKKIPMCVQCGALPGWAQVAFLSTPQPIYPPKNPPPSVVLLLCLLLFVNEKNEGNKPRRKIIKRKHQLRNTL